jgi:hypothetical protein
MANPTIEELDQLPIRITLRDADGALVVPVTARYRVDCKSTSTELVPWTAISADSVVQITIPATVNYIVNNANDVETKQVTAQVNYGTGQQVNKRYVYDVVNNQAYAA